MPRVYDLDPPLRVFEPPTPTCYSCGKPASIQLHAGLCCGRCALHISRDTLGTIAAVVMDLGAA